MAFSPDGKTVCSPRPATRWTARLWDAATGKPIGRPLMHQGGSSIAVAFSPDGKTVLTGGDDQTARLWDAATGEPIGAAFAHEQGSSSHVAYQSRRQDRVHRQRRPDGAAVGRRHRQTDRLAALAHPGPVYYVAYGPDGKTVLTGSCRPDGAALGRRHRPAGRHAVAASRHGPLRWRMPRWQAPC